MAKIALISTNDFCMYHHVEFTFINSLNEAGLIEVKTVGSNTFIPETELQKLERMIRLHHELDINLAGIEAIGHLLRRMESLQGEMHTLRNRLRRYEED